MLSPKPAAEPMASAVLFGELTLPVRYANERALAEGVALQEGRVVFEVLSRKANAEGVCYRYRALPIVAWQALAGSPCSGWPLVPQEVKRLREARAARLTEVVLLWVLGFVLCAAIIYQAQQLGALMRYASGIKAPAVAPGALPQNTPAPQLRWAHELNTILTAVGPLGGSIAAFQFTPEGNASVSLSFAGSSMPADVETLLAGALQKPVTQLKEGQWSWRE